MQVPARTLPAATPSYAGARRVTGSATALGRWVLAWLMPVAIMLLAFQTVLAVFMPPLKYFDEVLAGVAIALLLGRMISLRIARFELYVLGLLAWMLAVSFIWGKGGGYYDEIAQSIIHIKFFLLYVLLRPVLASPGAMARLERAFWITGALVAGGVILNALVGERFVALFGYVGMERFGGMRAVGFQLKPNDALLYLSPLLCLFVLVEAARGRRLTILAGMLFFLLLCVLNTSRTSMASLVLAALLLPSFGQGYRRTFAVGVAFLAVAFPFVLATDFFSAIIDLTIQNFREIAAIETSQYIRVIMLVKGLALATDYFPIGTGAATFGSVMSEGSRVYGEVGLYGLASVERFQGIYDSNLATLLGEFGFLGTLLYFALTFAMFRDVRIRLGVDEARTRAWHRVLALLFLLILVGNPFYSYIITSSACVLALVLGTWHLGRRHG